MLVPVMAVQVLSGLDTLWICDIYSQLIVGVLELQIMLEMIEKFWPECSLQMIEVEKLLWLSAKLRCGIPKHFKKCVVWSFDVAWEI